MSLTPPESLETARLLLRKPSADDARRLFASYARDQEVTRYLTWHPHRSVSESERVIARFIEAWVAETEFCWFMCSRETDELLGSLTARNHPTGIELGYVLARAAWGKGLMVEAVTAVTDWAFSEPMISQVRAICDNENRASIRVLEKAGFNNEGILRNWAVHPNISALPRDCVLFAKLRNT